MRDRKQYGIDLLLITVVVIWGFNFSVMKVAYQWIHPLVFNPIRYVIACVAMTIIMKLRGMSLRIQREDVPGIISLGFIAHTLYPIVFVLGLSRTKAGNAALLMALTPIFAYLIGVLLKRERFNPGVLGAIILSLAGVATLVFFGANEVSFEKSRTGDLLMIAAAACWGWYTAETTRWLPRYGAIRLTVFTMIAGTAMMLPLSIPWLINQNWSGIAPLAWISLGFSALLSIVYSYFIWAYALGRIGVAHTSVFNNVTPLVALFSGWLLLGEQPSAVQLGGVVLVLTGVFMIRSRKPTPVPDE